jgi:hypothetical protein
MNKFNLSGLVILTMALSFSVNAKTNLCDTLEDNGGSLDAVKTCRERVGESKAYKEKMRLQREAERRSAQVIRKEFSENDLLEAGFGNPFYAQEIKYRYDGRGILTMKEGKRLTKGDALCKYLGFEKAEVSRIKDELIDAEQAHGKGLIVSTNWIGAHSKEPAVYDIGKDYDHGVKTYESIVCVKLKQGADQEILSKVVEQVILINDQVNADAGSEDKQNIRVNDSSRSSRQIVGRNIESPTRFDAFIHGSSSGSER